MRKSYELAWLSAAVFYGTHDIIFSFVDDIQFVKPVPIGSIIEFVTFVAYSRSGYCVIHCRCYEFDISTNARTLTNVLKYVFSAAGLGVEVEARGPPASPSSFVEVMPREYNEILSYLEGKRTLDSMLAR